MAHAIPLRDSFEVDISSRLFQATREQPDVPAQFEVFLLPLFQHGKCLLERGRGGKTRFFQLLAQLCVFLP